MVVGAVVVVELVVVDVDVVVVVELVVVDVAVVVVVGGVVVLVVAAAVVRNLESVATLKWVEKYGWLPVAS